jgi:hypothetical protein
MTKPMTTAELDILLDNRARLRAREQTRARIRVLKFLGLCAVLLFGSMMLNQLTGNIDKAASAATTTAVTTSEASNETVITPILPTAQAAPTAAEQAAMAEKEADNRRDGCMKLQIATDSPYSETACGPAKIKKFLALAKGDWRFCIMAGGQTYNKNNKRHEKKQLPDGVAHDIFVACMMFIDGTSEKIAARITTSITK